MGAKLKTHITTTKESCLPLQQQDHKLQAQSTVRFIESRKCSERCCNQLILLRYWYTIETFI